MDLGSRLPEAVRESLTRWALSLATRTGLRRIPVYRVEGTLPASGAAAALLLAGHRPGAEYLPARFFDGEPSYRRLGSAPVWKLASLLERHGPGTELVIVRLDQGSASRWDAEKALPEHDSVRVPEWIGTRIPVPQDLEPLLRGGGSIRRDMTLVRRHGYEPATSVEAHDLHTFYSDFYRAFTHERHGETGYLRTETDLRRRLPRSEMLFVERQGERVAAGFYERVDDDLLLLALGTLDGDLALVKDGALAALYYFVLRRAQELGCSGVDLRGCRPVLNDGLLQFKKKWGAELCEKAETYYDLFVHWPEGGPVVFDFLSRCPLIVRDGEGFAALTGDASISSEKVWVRGLERLDLLNDDGRAVLLRSSGARCDRAVGVAERAADGVPVGSSAS